MESSGRLDRGLEFFVFQLRTLNSELRTEFSNPGLENYEGQSELD